MSAYKEAWLYGMWLFGGLTVNVWRELNRHKERFSGYEPINIRLTGDLVVEGECDFAILYSFGRIQSNEYDEDDVRAEVRSILFKSEGLHAVTKASKKAVFTDKSLMDIEVLSPKWRTYSNEEIISTGSSERMGGGLWTRTACKTFETSGWEPIGAPST